MIQSVLVARVTLCSVLIGAFAPASAQSYPGRPIRAIVQFPPGDGIDAVIRLLAPKLTERFGQPVVIDNRSGAGGSLGGASSPGRRR